MAKEIMIRLPVRAFRLPRALNQRLHYLLDRNSNREITRAERQEAEGLVTVAETFTLLNLRIERARNERRTSLPKDRVVTTNGVRRKK